MNIIFCISCGLFCPLHRILNFAFYSEILCIQQIVMILFRISYYIEICNASYSAQCRRAQQSAYCIFALYCRRPQLATFSSPRGGRACQSQPTQTRQGKVAGKGTSKFDHQIQIQIQIHHTQKKAPQPCPCPALLGQDLSSSLVPIHHPAPPSFLHHAVQMYCKCTNPTNYMYNIQLVFLLRGNLQGVRKNI